MLWEPRCSMRRDVQTDIMKQIVAFRNIAKEPIRNERVLY